VLTSPVSCDNDGAALQSDRCTLCQYLWSLRVAPGDLSPLDILSAFLSIATFTRRITVTSSATPKKKGSPQLSVHTIWFHLRTCVCALQRYASRFRTPVLVYFRLNWQSMTHCRACMWADVRGCDETSWHQRKSKLGLICPYSCYIFQPFVRLLPRAVRGS